ncbi:MAG: DUF4038 domain-containing protein [Vicinamibacterales bacterium]
MERTGKTRRVLPAACVLLMVSVPCGSGADNDGVPRWTPFEQVLESAIEYANPPQEASLTAVFTSPLGKAIKVYGFWDGGRTWRVRFAPDQLGTWTWKTTSSDTNNGGLHGRSGTFECSAQAGTGRFAGHGPIRISSDDRSFVHDDGAPFFFLGDTVWNGALLSTRDDWDTYLRTRAGQGFSAVQFVATQWRAAPDGDLKKELAYTGTERISINTAFFQRLDEKVAALNHAGLLAVPVMLWAINGGSNPQVNPGVSLPEDQAVLLARYMVARWGADQVAWILGGDADYRGAKAEKWKRIGRAVFGDIAHAPVTMHPGGMQWVWQEFADESWYGFVGYQSGHGDDDKTLRWQIDGPPAVDWMKQPHRPFVNLEPCYENHVAYQSRKAITAEQVRRAMYWSLLHTPAAGVSYGGHGVWGWDDGTRPPTDHAGSGIPLPWQQALTMPGATQMRHLAQYFTSIDFGRLRPAPEAVANQPGSQEPKRFIAAARTDGKGLLVLYVPEDRAVDVKADMLPPSPRASWFNPRTGEISTAVGEEADGVLRFRTPSEGDWILQFVAHGKPSKY